MMSHTTTSMIQFTDKHDRRSLAEALTVSTAAIRRFEGDNPSCKVDRGEYYNEDQLRTILEAYSQKNSRRSPEVQSRALEMLMLLNTTPILRGPERENIKKIVRKTADPKSKQKKKSTPKRQSAKGKTAIHGTTFLMIVFFAALLTQMFHTAHLLYNSDQSNVIPLAVSTAIIGAFAVHLPALLLTIHRGSQLYLRLYLGIDIAINLVYYAPWKQNTPEAWTSAVLLSFVIAFAIYAFAGLFAEKSTAV